MAITALVLALVTLVIQQPAVVLAQAPAASGTTTSQDYEFFKTRVQPIFLAKRPGRPRCISCHRDVASFPMEPLAAGATTWNEEQSRNNFEAVRRMIVPGNVRTSRLLLMPLRWEAGGTPFHFGGKHWNSVNDPEWQVLAAWVRGEKDVAFRPAATAPATAAAPPRARPAPTSGGGLKVRIIQTNGAGDNLHIIDPVTDTVVAEITGIEVNHGAAVPPDGSRIYVSNEADHTLDVVDAKTLQVTKQIPLTARPNNIAITRDGRKVYVAINFAPGGVDVIDTTTLTKAKHITLNGVTIHNPFVTPDGKHLVAASGSSQTRLGFVIDTQTDEPVGSFEFEQGTSIRPLAFTTNPDGSTKWILVNLAGLNGFAVVDFATRKEIRRIRNPYAGGDLKATIFSAGLTIPSHGVFVAPDGKTAWVSSRWDNCVYAYSLPDLKLIGYVPVGADPMWMTFTPDSRKLYVASNAAATVSVVDTTAMKELTRIPVGQGPRRNITAMLP